MYSINEIFQHVLKLPVNKQKDFADLLRVTSLDALIGANKIVKDRIDFMRVFQRILTDPNGRKTLKERQLQTLAAGEPWLFGEQYFLACEEATLTQVLKTHLAILTGKNKQVQKVSDKRLDIVFGAAIPQPDGRRREHLVVELKRPSVKITSKAIDQLQRYAKAVSADPRFDKTDTRWTFWALSNEVDELVRERLRDDGEYPLPQEPRFKLYVREWGSLIQDCEGRLKFYEDKLEYKASDKEGQKYIGRKFSNLLPESLLSMESSEEKSE